MIDELKYSYFIQGGSYVALTLLGKPPTDKAGIQNSGERRTTTCIFLLFLLKLIHRPVWSAGHFVFKKICHCKSSVVQIILSYRGYFRLIIREILSSICFFVLGPSLLIN